MKDVICFNCGEVYDEDSPDCVFFESQNIGLLHILGTPLLFESTYKKCPHCFATADNEEIKDAQLKKAFVHIVTFNTTEG